MGYGGPVLEQHPVLGRLGLSAGEHQADPPRDVLAVVGVDEVEDVAAFQLLGRVAQDLLDDPVPPGETAVRVENVEQAGHGVDYQLGAILLFPEPGHVAENADDVQSVVEEQRTEADLDRVSRILASGV